MTPDRDWLLSQGQDAFLLSAAASVFDGADARPVGVAVSGGGDSIALLHLMARLAMYHGGRLHAVTVNHGLRTAAINEAALVGKTCAELGVPHNILTWHREQTQGNLMAQARQARYDLMACWANEQGIARIALGHTGDDQAETFVMRLGRRAGVDGLASMAARFSQGGITFLRPLLSQRRAQLRGFLTRNGLTWCEDPTNDDPSFERTRARRALGVFAELGLDADTFCAVAQHLTSARTALNRMTEDAARQLVTQDRGDLIWPRAGFQALPDEIQRRLLQSALRWISGAVYPDRASALDQVLANIQCAKPATLAGCLIMAQANEVRLCREYNAVKAIRMSTNQTWDGCWAVQGPHGAGLEIAALGAAGLRECPAWRDQNMPRRSLLASPGIWQGDTLVAAPLAGLNPEWELKRVKPRDEFVAFLLSH